MATVKKEDIAGIQETREALSSVYRGVRVLNDLMDGVAKRISNKDPLNIGVDFASLTSSYKPLYDEGMSELRKRCEALPGWDS